MKHLILLISSLFLVSSLTAQNYVTKKTAGAKELKAYEKGQQYMMQNDMDKAIKEFDKAISFSPSFINAHLLRADSYKELGNSVEAYAGFNKVLDIDPAWKTKVHYVLGMMYARDQNFTEAARKFEDFLSYPQRSQSLVNKVNYLLKNVNFAKNAVKTPLKFEPENLGSAINSSALEYWPSISVDGETFTFTRQVNRNEDFMVSVKKDGKWQPAVNMGAPINTMMNEGAQSLSANGRFLTYTVCNRKGDLGKCDIYISEKKGDRWSQPKNIGAPISSSQWESQPSISADGNTLYFVRAVDSRSPDSNIFVSHKKGGKWSTPKRLGDEINTKFAEEAPFLHPDGQTLYFVSDGLPGMGNSDIYISRKQADGSWGQAENIGFPINSAEDEFGLIVSFDGKTGFFTSDKDGGEGKLDIYSFPMPEKIRPQAATYVQAIVYDAVTKKPLIANAEFVDLSNSLVHANSNTDAEGQFLVCLPLGKDYALNVSKPKYLFHSENFALKTIASRDEPYILKIYLQPIPEKKPVQVTTTVVAPTSKPIILKNVFFDTGSAVLLDVSKTELDKLVQLLQDNPSMNIQLNGHTDKVGSDTDNMTLSTNRAKSVRQYLERNGISASRLRSKGFGETTPIDTNDTKEGRANNRRTEFQIL